MLWFWPKRSANVTPLFSYCITYSQEDNCRWIVWLGRYTLDKETRVT